MNAVNASRKHRLWPVFVMPVLVVIAAAAWSAFWFYAASQVDQTEIVASAGASWCVSSTGLFVSTDRSAA